MAGAIVCGMLATAGVAEAKTFEVTRASDPNPGNCKARDCSLREAVLAANEKPGKDKVLLPDKRYRLTRANPGGVSEDVGTFGDLDINNDPLAITHPGKGKAKIDGNDIDRVFHLQDGAPTTFSKLKVTGGDAGLEDGGAIQADANVTLKRTTITRNFSDDGGGVDMDDGRFVMKRSALLANDTAGEGGGVDMDDGGLITRSRIVGNQAGDPGGGVMTDLGTTVINRTTIQGNRSAVTGGGINLEGALTTVRIDSSTISGNRAALTGGGLHIENGSAVALNSTFAGNRANDNGGGIHSMDGASVDLNAVTVARNLSGADDPGPPPPTGGGIYQIDSSFEVRNTLIALNEVGQGGLVPNDCEGETFTSLGNNVISTKVECDGFTQPTDLERPNPKIGKLSKNGGPTKTIELKRGSPAVGNAHNPSAPNRDQRGRKRDNQPDVGAFERGA